MWSLRGIAFVWCFVLSVTLALPVTKSENDSDSQKPVPVSFEALIDEKPTDNSKPSEMAVDPKPIEVKPTEQTKPSVPTGPTTTILETIPLDIAPHRPQMLYDQRQDGKYNIRADLENFVILVVPSSGNSLLDLLKRSGLGQQQHNKRQHHTKQHHKKYHVSGKPVEVKKAANRLDYLNHPDTADSSASDYIEGRTPYHVDISSDEILQPAAFGAVGTGVRSINGNVATIADLPLVNLEDNTASSASNADSTIILSTVTGKQSSNLHPSASSSNTETSPRFSKSIIIGGYGNPMSKLNSVLLTRNGDQHDSDLSKNYNNYFSRRSSVQIVDRTGENRRNGNAVDSSISINSPNSDLIDFTDSNTSFDSLNVGNIDRLALAGDMTRSDADLANAQWELTLLGAEEQCGPDRRRDSYGVCQFVPADYATT